MAGNDLWDAPPRLLPRKSSGGPGIPHRVPGDPQRASRIRVARNVLHRRIAGAAFHFCVKASEGVRGLAGASYRLALLRAVPARNLAAISLPGAAIDRDGFYFSWYAGFVPNVPDAAAEVLSAVRGFGNDGVHGGRDHRRTGDRLFLRSLRAPPRHDRLRARRSADDPAVDRGARDRVARRRGLSDAVLCARCMGRDPGSHERVDAAASPRLRAGLRLSGWDAPGWSRSLSGSAARRTFHVCPGNGRARGSSVPGRIADHWTRSRSPRYCVSKGRRAIFMNSE